MCKKSCGTLYDGVGGSGGCEQKEEEEECVWSGGIYLTGFLRNFKMSKQT